MTGSDGTLEDIVSRAISPNVLVLVYEREPGRARRCVDVRWEPLTVAAAIAGAEGEKLRRGLLTDTSSPDEIPL